MHLRPLLAALAAAVAVAALTACGGGDDPPANARAAEEAVKAAQQYLVAGVEGDTKTACGLLDPAFEAELENTASCEELVAAQVELAEQGKAEFDSQPIDPKNPDDLGLTAALAEGGNYASVTGPVGEQHIDLLFLQGEWRIVAVSDSSAPAD